MIIEVIRGLNMGGAETLLFTRLRYSRENRPSGFEETLVVNTLRGNDHYTAKIREIGVEVVELASPDPLRGAVELSRLVRSIRPAPTIVFHSPVTTYLHKARRFLGGRAREARLIDVVHSTHYRAPYRLLGSALDRFSDLAIAVGDDVAAAPTSRHYRKVRTVLAGVDVGRMQEWIRVNGDAPRQMRETLGVPDGDRLAVAVGSLIPLKGHRHAIEALALPGLEQVSFALVGDGTEREALEALAFERGVDERVHFVGRVDDAWRWTAVADVLVHPSYFEGLPVAVMEAAALGTPIVGTEVGGLHQIVSGDVVGRLIAEPDATLIAGAVAEVLTMAVPARDAYRDRAGGASFWSMERYAKEFYSAVSADGI